MIGPVESGLSIRAHLHAVQCGNPAMGQSCNRAILQLSHRQSEATTQRIWAAHQRHAPRLGSSLGSLMTTAVITVTLRRNNAIIQIVFLEICLHHCSSSLREWAEKKTKIGKTQENHMCAKRWILYIL